MTVFDVVKENKWKVIIGFIAKVTEAILELLVPLVMAAIINNGINRNNPDYVIRMGIWLVILPILGYLFALLCQWFASVAAQSVGTRMRGLLFRQMNQLDYLQNSNIGASTINTRINNDTHNIQQMLAMIVRLASRAPVLLIGAIFMAFWVSPELSPIFIIGGILLGLLLSWITIYANKKFGIIQGTLDDLTVTTRENLNGVRDIRAFANQSSEIKDFENDNLSMKLQQLFVGKIQALANPGSLFIVNIAIGFILYFGARLVNNGFFMQGEVVALVNYMNAVLLAINTLVQIIILISKGFAGVKRVNNYLSMEPMIIDKETEGHEVKKITEYGIRFNHVMYAYADKPTLNDIHLSVEENEFLGVIGGTASGKTTFINLIPRIIQPTSGDITIGRVPVEEYSLSELRNQIAVVPQTALLLSGSLRDNMKIGNHNATDEEIWQALKKAQAYDFIAQNEKGLDYHVNQGGKNFSGGQRQRLTIARALVKNPKILILDDSVSALDYQTEALLKKQLSSLKMTVIMVSQRVSSIIDADKILVLDGGNVAGIGTHNELIDRSRVYKSIVDSQKKGE